MLRITGTVTAYNAAKEDAPLDTRTFRPFTVEDDTPWTDIVDTAFERCTFKHTSRTEWVVETEDITETEITTPHE